MSWALRHNETVLCEVAAQRIDQLRSLAHEQIAGPEDHGARLLLLGLHCDEAHCRPRTCFGNGFRVRRIVLVPLHIWLDVASWNEAYVVAELLDRATPVMSAGACLHNTGGRHAS